MRFRPDTEALAVRSVAALAAAALGVSVACGVVLAVRYRPHELAGLRVMHTAGAALALISAIAAVVVARAGRLRATRRSAVAVVVWVLIVGSALATGSSLAWTGGTPATRGVLLSGADHVVVSGKSVSGSSVSLAFVLHTVLGTGAVALFLWAVARQRRRIEGSGGSVDVA